MAQVLYQNIETGDAHDITTLVKSARWKTRRVGSPAQLSLTLIADPAIEITEGGIVTLTENGTGLFYGYVFKYSRNESEEISVTAYDQMRYLKNKDTYVFTGQNSGRDHRPDLCRLRHQGGGTGAYRLCDPLNGGGRADPV